MYDRLNIAALPLDISVGNYQANMQYAELAFSKAPKGVDLIILPELFSTGYIADPTKARDLAQNTDGETINYLKNTAKKLNCAIAGSFLCSDNNNLYNRGFIIEPHGDTTFYDKHHLFNLSEESKVVTPGEKLPPVARFRGWNIAIAVCYDLRFPAWLRNIGLKYDLLIIPANWPQKRAFAWQHLLQARAIENQAYVVGCNRSGKDDYGCYDDETYVFDYMGQSIGETDGMYINAVLSRDSLEKIRSAFPVWKDADSIMILGD